MINIFEPNVGPESEALLKEVFDSKWLGRGEYVNQFEEGLCEYLGVNRENFHTIASCSDALFAAFKPFDLPLSSKIVIPSNSFPALPSAILENGLEPLIVDVDPSTGNICLDSLKKNFNENCSGVFVTDYGGVPNDIEAIRNIVGKETIVFVDAAASLGTFVDGEFSGKQADFCCWSFDAMKLLVCGEGGGAYYKDPKNLLKFKEYNYLGLPATQKSGLDRAKGNDPWWEYDLVVPGRRSVFTNINAAIGLPQIEKLEDKISRRSQIRASYLKSFANLKGVKTLNQVNSNTRYSNYFFGIVSEHRNELAFYLKENGVYSTFRYHPTHRISIFEKYAVSCPKSDLLAEQTLNIPIHEALSDEDVKKISELVCGFFDRLEN